MQDVFVPVQAQQQLVGIVDLQGVQPIGGVTIGVVVVQRTLRVIVFGVAFVFAVADIDTTQPAVVELGAEIARGAAELEVFIRAGAREQVIELGFAALVEGADADFQLLVELMRDIQAQGTITQGVVITIVA